MAITDFGGAMVSLWAPDRDGAMADVVLGYETVAGYLAGKSFFGAIIGRFGNRIARWAVHARWKGVRAAAK